MVKVKWEDTVEYKILSWVDALNGEVFLRKDLRPLAHDRQISRALLKLIGKGRIIRLGHGVYARMAYSQRAGIGFLKNGFMMTAREALTRLGIRWELSDFEKDYNEGRSQQVPVSPATKVFQRVRRSISYRGMMLRYE